MDSEMRYLGSRNWKTRWCVTEIMEREDSGVTFRIFPGVTE